MEGTDRRRENDCRIFDIDKKVAVIETTILSLDKRINGSLLAIEKHINEGKGWRTTIAGLTIAIALQIISFSYLYGRLNKQVEVNTKRLENIEVIQKGDQNGRIIKVGA